jgi:hypothetical protein
VSIERHDWDRDERAALAGLEDQIEAMASRHRDDPPLAMLRAAQADALPPDLQGAIADHLSASAFSRTIADGLGDDEPALTPDAQDRLLARITKEARTAQDTGRAWGWLRPLLAGSGIVAVGAGLWLVASRIEVAEPIAPPETTVAVSLPPAAPPFLLPFEKPEVTLGMAALTWRGSQGSNQLLADLKPGLDAYREGDYATADRALTALADRYPGTIEILFYQGVSRLFLNNLSGAIASLNAAEMVGDRTFAADVAWYRAVAEQRAGNLGDARTRLDALCREQGKGAARACGALDQLTKAAPALR